MSWITTILALFAAIPKFISEIGVTFRAIEYRFKKSKARKRKNEKDNNVDSAIDDALSDDELSS